MTAAAVGARRSSLAARISLLAVAVVALTAVIAGGLGVGLIRQTSGQAARQQLSTVADETQSEMTSGVTVRERVAFAALKISIGTFGRTGTVTSTNPRARVALSAVEVSKVLAGGSVSASRVVQGRSMLIEARPTSTGGFVLVQRRSDAVSVGDKAIRRLLVAIAVAALVAVALGLAFAWRLARPLRRTASAAHALAAGRRDISVPIEGPAEVAEVAEAVQILAASLATSEARQREFLLAVSHDLRTPLTAISGYAESLSDGVVAADQISQTGTVMLAEARRLERLVADLLDLARLEAREFRIDPVEIDAVALLCEAGSVWENRCSAAGVRFLLEVPSAPVRIVSDPVRIRQIVDGLLENALRLTPSGRPIVLAGRLESDFGPGSEKDRAPSFVFDVRDGGPGLTDADLAVAFDRFTLYERYRGIRQVGTGLGLAIVARLTERLGGRVVAGHAPEGGARFTVRLPHSTPDPYAT